MKDKTIKIDLSKIANTALQEKVDKELEKVLDNILDPIRLFKNRTCKQR